MTQHKLTYEQEDAADFLEITLRQLSILTALGHIRIQTYRKREFYLAGELDAVKCNIQHLVRQFAGPKSLRDPHLSQISKNLAFST